MHMETLVLDGKTFVKASKAARELGYTSDYVGQLCRSGQVNAHLVGRTWYVDQEQLSGHRVEKKRMSRVKAREQAHRSIEEHRKKALEVKQDPRERRVSIRYEGDDSDLIPTPRKLIVEAEAVQKAAKLTQKVKAEEPSYEIENQGEKIIYSGKLKLVDLNEEETTIDKDTVVLTARVNRKKISDTTKQRVAEPLVPLDTTEREDEESVATAEKTTEYVPISNKKDFIDRLHDHDVAVNEEGDVATEYADTGVSTDDDAYIAAPIQQKRVGALSALFGVALPIILVLGLLAVERSFMYVSTDNGTVRTATFNIDPERAINIIRSKI